MADPGSNTRTVAFLGFGEAGRAFQASLAKSRPEFRFIAYDIKLGGAGKKEMEEAMEAARVRAAESAAELAAAQWIFSAVTADQSLKAIEPLLPALGKDNLLIDINSVSPGRKQRAATLVGDTGADYLDMAVMAPVHPRGHATPVLLAGETAETLAADLGAVGFSFSLAGSQPGAATAIKMVRSLFVKGLEAITVEALLAAEASGCRDAILASLSSSYPGLGWPEIASYNLERTLVHGVRRAAEMDECAVTLKDLGLAGDLATAIAEVQRAQGKAGETVRTDGLDETLAKNLRKRLHVRD